MALAAAGWAEQQKIGALFEPTVACGKVLRVAHFADKMRIKGIGEEYAELLEAAGVDTVRELKYRNPANLAKRVAEVNKRLKLVRALPSEKVVLRWIETAKKLPIKINY